MNEEMIMDEAYGVYTDTGECFDETEESYVIYPEEKSGETENAERDRTDKEEGDNGVTEQIRISNQIDLYRFLNEHTAKLVSGAEVFKDFCMKAVLYDRNYNAFDISDSILIYSQKPDARYVYDMVQLEEAGYGLMENAEPILLLDGVSDVEEILTERTSKKRGKKTDKKAVAEPDESDTEIMEILRVRRFYDISQIYSYQIREARIEFADKGAAAEGIVMVTPCELQYSNSAPSRKHACYDHSKNVITYTNGCKSYDGIFADLVCEYAHYEIAAMTEQQFNREKKDDSEKFIYSRKSFLFHAECVSYIICRLYGINPGIYDFTHIHQSWTEMTPIQIRLNLTRILTAALNIDTRIQNLLADCLQYMNLPDDSLEDTEGDGADEG